MKTSGLNSWRSWIVAVACAVVYCLFATVYRLAAIFYAAFVDQFNIDRKSASIPFVVLGFVRCSSVFFQFLAFSIFFRISQSRTNLGMKTSGLNSWRSWIVAVACAVVYCLFATVYRLAAIFYAAFVDQFNIDRKSASIPFVVLGFVRCSSVFFQFLAFSIFFRISQSRTNLGMKTSGLNSWRSWIVAVACAVVYCLFATVYRLAAIFYAAFVDQFNIDRKSASIPFVVLGFVRCSSGSIYGILGERFGLRRMALIGCCLSLIGLTASFFAQDVIALSITIGLIHGFGMTCTALLPTIIRSFFDNTATSTSNGIVNLGPAFCAIIFPGILMYFIDVYGVSGALLMSSGILLNALPLIMLLRKPGREVPTAQTKATQNDKKCKLNVQQDKTLKDIHNSELQYMQSTNAGEDLNVNKDSSDRREMQKSNDKPDSVKITSTFIEKKVSKCLLHDRKGCFCLHSIQKEYIIQNDSDLNKIKVISQTLKQESNEESRPVSKLTDIADDLKFNKQESIQHQRNISEYLKGERLENHQQIDKSIFHSLNVLKDPTFLALTFIQGISVYTYHIWLTTLIDYSRDKGIDRHYEIYILTLNAVTDIVGRLGLTWVTDKSYLSTANFSALLFILNGASSIWMALANSFAMLTSGSMLMIFAGGAFLSIAPGMSYAYIEKDKQILSIASYGTLNAPLIFTVSPLTGYFRGKLGSYDGLYYLIAVLNFICSLIVLMLPRLANLREKKKLKKSQPDA